MSPNEIEQPFDSIESAQDYLNVLADTILDEMTSLKRDYDLAVRQGEERRGRALELAMFKLKTLGCNLQKCRRALNDLRTLRRLILNERLTLEQIASM
ncbi:MAG TPA: hypothetical protein VKU19_17135 [Bryobacteraceae bacterium]|nr:hypothetical protein [Bryobacteraceae bacterium]